MKRRDRIPNLGGARAIVLHRPHAAASAVTRQLGAIGLKAEEHWPDLPADAALADFLFVDADMACDQQLPWQPGEAPMPLIALIGSEAPGRIEWALSQRADSHLMKPIGNAGIYSALLIARQKFEERLAAASDIAALKARIAERRIVVQAMLILSARGLTEEAAFGLLRQQAMDTRGTIEEAAAALVADAKPTGGRDERTTRR